MKPRAADGRLSVLIAGGYGTFGGHIVELVADEPRLTLIVAGRSRDKAASFCASHKSAKATLVPARFDRSTDVAAQLRALAPDIVVDASGPFQAYGKSPYALVEACIALRISYLDLADGSEFVAGISAFDDSAKTAGCFVLSGVSSCPVLTAAVVRRLAGDMARIDSIYGGIAPSPFAGVGENVLRAVASYSGKRISMRRNGRTESGYPFTDHKWFTIAPPGYLPLHPRRFSLVEVPDLWALSELWPDVGTVWMGASPVPALWHRCLSACAWLARWGLIGSAAFLAPLMRIAVNRLRWGDHRGGMFVEVSGIDAAGAPTTRAWHLIAEGTNGPFIPSMGIAAILQKLVAGQRPPPGARAGTRDVELSDYEELFDRRGIVTGIRKEVSAPAPIFKQVLGSAWEKLPPVIRALHGPSDGALFEGRGSVERGRGLLARLAAAMVGFPGTAKDVPVRVHFAIRDGKEVWTRTFGKQQFSSVLSVGRGKFEHLICERFGPLAFGIALPLEAGQLWYVIRRWTAFGLPMPQWLCPRSETYESAEDGIFHFRIEIRHPLAGLVVAYRGWLKPVSTRDGLSEAA